jgi:predicted site-specific integrase-resolvase
MKTLEKIGAPMRTEEYLTAGKAAERLHVSAKTLSRYRLQGRLGTVRTQRTLGGPGGRGHYRYNAADIDELVELLSGPNEEAS